MTLFGVSLLGRETVQLEFSHRGVNAVERHSRMMSALDNTASDRNDRMGAIRA